MTPTDLHAQPPAHLPAHPRRAFLCRSGSAIATLMTLTTSGRSGAQPAAEPMNTLHSAAARPAACPDIVARAALPSR